MRIVVVHNAVSAESTPDEQDVLVQAEAVSDAIQALGHDTITLSCGLDLSAVKRRLTALDPVLVFNLVESLDGYGRLIHLFPALLDTMGLPYTGSHTEAVCMTSHKVMAKRLMLYNGLPTPVWIGPYPQDLTSTFSPKPPPVTDDKPQNWIVKSLWEHASVGLESDSIVGEKTAAKLLRELSVRAPRLGGACFAEAYVDGREFNLALLADGPEGPQVLPPAEIVFEGYDASRPCIVGYRAKWREDSYEYHHTPRRFDFGSEDDALLTTLKDMALQCWQVFNLKGYARVDFRVDDTGKPWILEINANPCLSPDAGFAAALETAGITYTQAVNRIIQDGLTCHSILPQNAAAVSSN